MNPLYRTRAADRPRHSRAVLAACNIPLGTDFHTLSSSKVECLLSWANHDKYRQPKNANGSRARYYHDMLQRRAARQP